MRGGDFKDLQFSVTGKQDRDQNFTEKAEAEGVGQLVPLRGVIGFGLLPQETACRIAN